jgi:hypothetical protein
MMIKKMIPVIPAMILGCGAYGTYQRVNDANDTISIGRCQ